MFHAAKWICHQDEITDGSYYFRKSFILPVAPIKAELSVCGLGYGEYTINGGRVTQEVLTTPFTRFDKTVLYNTWDVSTLLLAGINVIGVYLGNGWYNDVGSVWEFDHAVWRDHPKMILQLDILLPDGKRVRIVSDSSWKSHPGPSVYNHIREGEIYDARLELSDWNKAGHDEKEWRQATICPGAGGILQQTKAPPIRIMETLKAESIGEGIYDFGVNISGWVQITGRAEKGHETAIYYGEKLTPDKKNLDNEKLTRYMKRELKACDKYIFAGKEIEVWSPQFVYHGFRYVKVESAPTDFEICAKVVHADIPVIGNFECSNEMLNKIHKAACRTTLTNMQSIPTDCPHREQLGWTADAMAVARQALFNYDMFTFYEKWMGDFRDVQRSNGQLPGIVPTSSWGYNWGSGPGWDSALIHIPYEVYCVTGSKKLIQQMWNCMCSYMDYMQTMTQDGLVDYGLADWCTPPGANICPSVITDTVYYYANARIMDKCSQLINGKKSNFYRKLAIKIRKDFREKFIKNGMIEGDSQTALACAIYYGLYHKNEMEKAAKHLNQLVIAKGYHIDCGLLGTRCIFSALSDYGYAETVYKMVTNPTMPSYTWWILNGMTTFCENWEMGDSLNHPMFSEVEAWFYQYLGGIRFEEGRLTIKPYFLKSVDWVKAKHRDIQVEWTKNKLTVIVPCFTNVIINEKEYLVEKGTHVFNLAENK